MIVAGLREARPADNAYKTGDLCRVSVCWPVRWDGAVLVDDAHWLDGSSADALLFAFRRLVADPVAVVLAMRQGEPSLLDGADLPGLRLHGPGPGVSSGAAAVPR
jgi:hypothetical protein